jgi:hypothetical protein
MSTDKSERETYPTLPEGWTTTMTPDPEGTPITWFDEVQMREYVDADRKDRQLAACNFCLEQAAKARAAQPSQPATVVPVADDLHGRIMNVPIPMAPKIPADAGVMLAYKLGHRDARHAAAELALVHPSAPAESGWQWVPVEPTQEMIDALHDEIEHEVQTGTDQDGNYAEVSVLDAATLPAAYRSMLKAAPSAAQPGGEGGDRG